jgi:hypothetical protein
MSLDSGVALGQGASKPPEPKIARLNFEVQLHLLIASNETGEKGNVPQSLESVVKQLRPSLPYANYRVVATFVNRLTDGGTLELKGALSSALLTTGLPTPLPQSAYEFTLFQVKLDTDDEGKPAIQIPKFRFGLSLPVITGTSRAEGIFPAVTYQPAGITTEVSLREGVPTLVGTLNTSRPDQMLILVTSVKRTM